MSAAELSYIVTLVDAAQGKSIILSADGDARAAIAQRLSLIALDRFDVAAEVRAVAGGLAVTGRIAAELVQSCAATDLPVPATIDEPFDLRFLRNAAPELAADEEYEIGDEEIDVLPLEHDRVDVGEVAIQTLSLALDPFPRHPDAARILAEKGVLSEREAGPFAALAALKGKLSS